MKIQVFNYTCTVDRGDDRPLLFLYLSHEPRRIPGQDGYGNRDAIIDAMPAMTSAKPAVPLERAASGATQQEKRKPWKGLIKGRTQHDKVHGDNLAPPSHEDAQTGQAREQPKRAGDDSAVMPPAQRPKPDHDAGKGVTGDKPTAMPHDLLTASPHRNP